MSNIGDAYDYLDQDNKAIGFYQQALLLFQHIGDKKKETETLLYLAFAYKELRQYNKAVSLYEKALPMLRQIGDKRGEEVTLKDLAFARKQLDIGQAKRPK